MLTPYNQFKLSKFKNSNLDYFIVHFKALSNTAILLNLKQSSS